MLDNLNNSYRKAKGYLFKGIVRESYNKTGRHSYRVTIPPHIMESEELRKGSKLRLAIVEIDD